MKYRLLVFASITLLVGCDTQKTVPPDPERQKLEAERAQLEKDKAKLAEEKRAEEEKRAAAEKLAAETEKKALANESQRLAAERKKLEADKAKLDKDRAKIALEKTTVTEAEAAADRMADAKLAEQQAALAMAEARTNAERRRLEDLKIKAEADRMNAERAILEAQKREADAKREQEEAIRHSTAIFYGALEGLGDWFETDRYGFVWRPYDAAARGTSWRPYSDGRWQLTEYGWTWQSNEPFGWAVYHYGRWAHVDELGWIWTPGSDWAPAWVAWRWHRQREFVGWAPLPPEAVGKTFNTKVDALFDIGPETYGFIAVADFDAPTYAGKFVPRERLREIMPKTQNVTFIASRPGGAMLCGGPDSGLINTELRRLREDPEIKPVAHIALQVTNSAPVASAPDTMNAGALMLFAPQLRATPATSRPKKVKARVEVKNADRGWDESKPWQMDEWRARIKAEAASEEAAERAAANRPPPPPPSRPAATPTPTPTPRPQAAPNPAPQPSQPAPQRPGRLSPSRLEPSSPLFPRKN